MWTENTLRAAALRSPFLVVGMANLQPIWTTDRKTLDTRTLYT